MIRIFNDQNGTLHLPKNQLSLVMESIRPRQHLFKLTHDQKVDMARTLLMDNPARVANVVKNWVGEDT